MKKNVIYVERQESNFKKIYFILTAIILPLLIIGTLLSKPSGNVQVISITGAITSSTGDFLSTGTTSDYIVDALESAESDNSIKAVILEINSPGGTVVGSVEAVEKVKSMEKPVIAWIREVGASGAYWIASASDAIVAHNLSITGSVGVTASYLEFTGFMDRYNISYVDLSLPENKEIGSQFKNLTEEERLILENILEKTYAYFLEDVAVNRKIDKEVLKARTNKGSIILGDEAYKLGLIDYLGGKETAINVTKKLANLTDIELLYTQQDLSIFSALRNIKSNVYSLEEFSLKAI